MHKISGCVITFNEEEKISDCLRSLDFCDEIVVVDSFSTDRTLEVIEGLREQLSASLRLEQHEFKGYAAQKNYATSLCSHDWVYNLDADERISDRLKESLLALKESAGELPCDVYRNNRRTFYVFDWVNHGGWYPDSKVRFFNKNAGSWQGADQNLHEDFYAPGAKTGLLAGDILHYSFDSISDHIRVIDKYTTIAADEAVSLGKKVSVFSIISHSAAIFIKMYIVRRGFLDGALGLIVAGMSSFHVWSKYSKIWVLSRKNSHMKQDRAVGKK